MVVVVYVAAVVRSCVLWKLERLLLEVRDVFYVFMNSCVYVFVRVCVLVNQIYVSLIYLIIASR